jgi:signal transduction histidine kinase/ligand-binding sensor domain-containing protein
MRWPFPVRISILAVAAWLGSGTAALAVDGSLRFDHLTADNGLSNSWVYCILKDSRGFMWFGTADGLNRYDGSSIKVYRYDPNDPTSLPSSRVGFLFEDSRQRLWVGGWEEGGLALYDRDKDRFQRHPSGGGPRSLGGLGVNSMLEDERGRLWLATPNGLDSFEPDAHVFSHFRHDPDDPQSLHDDRTTCLLDDRRQGLWVGTRSGLTHFDRRTGKFTRRPFGPGSGGGREYPDIADLYQDAQGRLWVATLGDGLIRFDPATGETQRYVPDSRGANTINQIQVRRIVGDGQRRLFIGTENGGLNVLDTNTGRFSHFLPDPEDETTINSNSIWALRFDDQGILWIGTFNGGVHMLSPAGQRFRHLRARRDGLSNPHVTAGLEDGQGVLWIATDGGGLNRLDPQTGRFTYFTHDPADPDSISDDVVLALHEDRSGAIWAATWKGGLKRLDPRSRRITRFRHDDGDLDSIADDTTWTIVEDESGELILATYTGVDILDPRTGKACRFSSRYPGAGKGYCNTLARDRQGHYWIALAYGVERVDARTGQIVRFTADPASPGGLGRDIVNALYTDSRGNVWLGTAGGGLNSVAAESGAWRRFTSADGLPGDNIASILEDAQGNLWLGTNQGLSKFTDAVRLPDQPRFVNFDVRDGLQGQEFRARAAFRTRQDELFIGGNRGLTSFYPRDIVPNPHKPPVVLTSLKIFNRPVGIGVADSPLAKQISETSELTLSYRHSVVTFEFAALDFVIPRKNQYRCKLEGFDPEWHFMGTQRSATYTNLPPGPYVLRVMASNNDGVWNEDGVALRIRVTPPFWRARWFLVLTGIAVAASLFSGYRWRVAALEARERRLARMVEERTTDLQREIAEHKITEERLAAERDLRQALMERELVAEERTRIARELHDSLAQNFAGLSLQLESVALDLPSDAEAPRASLDVASRMLRHCQTESRRAVWDLRSPVAETVPLKRTLEEALAPLLAAGKPHIEVEVEPADAALRPQMQRDVTRIAEEGVTNAVKHAQASLVSVRCKVKADDVWLEVRDDGQGFVPGDEGGPVAGFGILGMRERAARLGARLDIVSRRGAGTCVSLRCPEGLLSPRLLALRGRMQREDGGAS